MNRKCPTKFHRFQNSRNTILDIFISLFMYIFIFFLLPILGLTNPSPIKEISSSRLVRKTRYSHIVPEHGMMHNALAKHRVK
jgi:hypothetical protein